MHTGIHIVRNVLLYVCLFTVTGKMLYPNVSVSETAGRGMRQASQKLYVSAWQFGTA